MKILVINTGSSSIKYQLINMVDNSVMASGLVERIGENISNLEHTAFKNGKEIEFEKEEAIADHRVGLEKVAALLVDSEYGCIDSHDEIQGVGHRVVHGGEDFHKPTVIDDEVVEAIKKNVPLAPLHNPANLIGIEVGKTVFSKAIHVAVFDTAFHQTMPQHAYMYAIPYENYEKFHIRRYGFHGTSHNYVAHETAKFLGKPIEELNIITVHLGNGSSMTAVQKGKCIDTSMGMTPLAGLIMGTRCGDMDPAVPFFLAQNNDCTIERIDNMLNKKSGLLGICGKNDLREILKQVEEGDEKSKLALDMLIYRVKKFIGEYYAVLGTVDAIVFTAGIGENSPEVRGGACEGLEKFGIEIDPEKNAPRSKQPRVISTDSSDVKVLVVPTNEELQIATESFEILEKLLNTSARS